MTRLSIKLLLAIFIFCFIFSCQNTGETSTAEKIAANKDAGMYTYGDGTGGIYTITTDSILFNPVTVILKSKDPYDSGQIANIGISKSQHAKLTAILDSALEDTANHLEKRTKGSSVIALFRPRQPRKKCILAPGSGPQIDLENALKKLIEG